MWYVELTNVIGQTERHEFPTRAAAREYARAVTGWEGIESVRIGDAR